MYLSNFPAAVCVLTSEVKLSANSSASSNFFSAYPSEQNVSNLALICSTEPANPIIVSNEISAPAATVSLKVVNPQGTLFAKHCFFERTPSREFSIKLAGVIKDKSYPKTVSTS